MAGNWRTVGLALRLSIVSVLLRISELERMQSAESREQLLFDTTTIFI